MTEKHHAEGTDINRDVARLSRLLEQVGRETPYPVEAILAFLVVLKEQGYVVFHLDDIPEGEPCPSCAERMEQFPCACDGGPFDASARHHYACRGGLWRFVTSQNLH